VRPERLAPSSVICALAACGAAAELDAELCADDELELLDPPLQANNTSANVAASADRIGMA
jgi:hypothetical protein